MDKSKFKTLSDVINYVDGASKEAQTLTSDLKLKSKGRLRRFFSASEYEKREFKLYKNETEDKIFEKTMATYDGEEYIGHICNFNYKKVIDFIPKVLSIIEGEKYTAEHLDLTSTNTSFNPFVPFYGMLSDDTEHEYLYLITNEENKKKIKNICKKYESIDPEIIKDAIKDKKYILLDDIYNKYALFNYSEKKVPTELIENFPYLSDIIVNLINVRVSNPKIGQSQAMQIVIDQIHEKYAAIIPGEKGKSI